MLATNPESSGTSESGRLALRIRCVHTHATILPPVIQLGLVRVHTSRLAVEVAMDRQALFALPTGHRPHTAIEVCGDLLPGIQPIIRHRRLATVNNDR